MNFDNVVSLDDHMIGHGAAALYVWTGQIHGQSTIGIVVTAKRVTTRSIDQGRKSMSTNERAEVSQRMKLYWAKRRAER